MKMYLNWQRALNVSGPCAYADMLLEINYHCFLILILQSKYSSSCAWIETFVNQWHYQHNWLLSFSCQIPNVKGKENSSTWCSEGEFWEFCVKKYPFFFSIYNLDVKQECLNKPCMQTLLEPQYFPAERLADGCNESSSLFLSLSKSFPKTWIF